MAEEEGMSTPKKVATGAAVGLATAAAVGVGKKLLGSDGDSDDDGDSGGSQPSRSRRGGTSSGTKSRSATKPQSSAKPRSTSGSSTRSRSSSSSRRSSGGATRTKEQLYNQAKRLKIEGRSKMTKAQLERAVERTKR